MTFSHTLASAKRALAANKAAMQQADSRALTVTILAVVLLMGFAPGIAMAAPWDGVANSILGIFTGGLARTIAIIAVIACGIAAVAGKLSWDWAIKIVLGIVLIFGATTFVDYIISAAA